MTVKDHRCDVAIVGAGPVGLVTAMRFARLGLSCAVVEKQPNYAIARPQDDGREIALSHRSMDFLQETGVGQYLDARTFGYIKTAHVLDKSSPHALDFTAENAGQKCLATMVSNHHIRHAAYLAASHADNVEWFCGRVVSQAETNARGGVLTLDDGQRIRARLVIAADSRFSQLRDCMGIAAEKHDFKRVMILVKMAHELPHNDEAFECFQDVNTLAVLPLTGNTSSIILTVPQKMADYYMSVDGDAFAVMVGNWFGWRHGKMRISGQRHAYPLVATYAKRFTAHSFALLGDAAVGMHPVTAHGFNFGLRGIEILSTLASQALAKNLDFAADQVLESYERQLRATTRPLYLATNAIATLYARSDPASSILRHGLITAGRSLPVVRHFIERQLVDRRRERHAA